MRDSYENFFDYFKIDFSKVVKYGVEIDTIFPAPETIDIYWEELKKRITTNGDVYIRGYGRDTKGTALFQELYKVLLNNTKIKKDATNNQNPTELLQLITPYSKKINHDKFGKEKIANYQVTHIWGRTKNPFLFTAPWNIVWKPKILDPFTGHESKGKNTETYKMEFLRKAEDIYKNFIDDYNILVKEHFLPSKIEKAFNCMNIPEGITEKQFESFKIDANKELQPIEKLLTP